MLTVSKITMGQVRGVGKSFANIFCNYFMQQSQRVRKLAKVLNYAIFGELITFSGCSSGKEYCW